MAGCLLDQLLYLLFDFDDAALVSRQVLTFLLSQLDCVDDLLSLEFFRDSLDNEFSHRVQLFLSLGFVIVGIHQL